MKSKKRAKKRRKPYDGDPMMVTKLARWGTKAEGKANAKERAFKNRIHDLETALAGANVVIDNLSKARADLERRLDAAASPRHIQALRRVCLLPIRESVSLGIDQELLTLCVWLADLEGRVASGKAGA